MANITWDFPPLGSGNEQGYTNSGIQLFRGDLIQNLAREICQNSLDAHDETIDAPVEVRFSLVNVRKDDHPMFAQYAECIEGCERYWGDRMDTRLGNFMTSVRKAISHEYIPCLVASDYKTKGLTGAKADMSTKSVWRALAHSDGTSVNKQSDSAGSFGIGKNAPFACSRLSTVFYSTYAQDGVRAFQGVARLATIIDKATGKPTQGIGHYLAIENEGAWHPIFPEDNCSFRDLFPRDEIGTDIIIVGFSSDSWETSMIQAVLCNFFLAIIERRLVVRIGETVISADTIGNLIEQHKSDSTDMRNTHEWYTALIEPEDGLVRKTTILTEDDVELYIRADNTFSNYVASFRPTGMLIRKYRKAILQHFSAVLVVRGTQLSELLKDAEPPKHNYWDHKLIEDDKTRRKQAKEAIEKMDAWVLEELKNKYEAVTESWIDSGEGDYLPDDTDSMAGQQLGDDILRVRQKISGISTVERVIATQRGGSKPGTGTAKPGDVHGGDRRRKKKKKGKKVVDGPGDTQGKVLGKDGKPLTLIELVDQRAFAIAPDLGLYRVIATSGRDSKKAFFTFSAIGEDEREEQLVIEKYAHDGQTYPADGATIGPIAVKKGIPCELYVTFRNKEKMRLDILTTEGK